VPDPGIVVDPREVTPEWLTAVLHRAGYDTTVRSFTSEPVGTGQMAHNERFVLQCDDPDAAPSSVVGKFPSPNAESRAAGAAGGYRNEVSFYAELAETLAVRTPHCYFGAISDDFTEFTLILEDLHPARQGDQLAGCDPAQLVAAAENLAGLHAPRWGDATLRDLSWVSDALGEQAVAIVQLITPMFIERYAVDLSPATVAVLEAFASGIERWFEREPPRFSVVHGDYRLDNLLFAPVPDSDGCDPVATVDWQTVIIGNPGRDLAYLLGTSVEPPLRREIEGEVRSAYLARLDALGVTDVDLDTVVSDERHGAFQGPFITMLGAIAVGRTERGDRMFVAMAERSAAHVRDVDALDLLV
jgi:aminoglycoside/choline kinase family phosphotransferase